MRQTFARYKQGAIIIISSQELRNKEVINMSNGKSLGFVTDIEINLEKSRIDALVLPVAGSFFSFFSKNGEIEIKWKDVKVIGEDVILVNLPIHRDIEENYGEIDGYVLEE